MKHITAKLLLAALLAGVSAAAGAANPFSDVKTTDWSYQAVTKLAQEGVVTGYPDGTFAGEKPITRYEMAKITAGLMAREQELSAAQQETVKKLSGEYAGELENLGVRVSELEKKVSNTQVILEWRLNYLPVYDNIYKDSKESHDLFGSRLRLNTITKVDDRIHVYGQGQVLMGLGGEDYIPRNSYNYESKDGEFTLTRLFSTYHFGDNKGDDRGFGPSKDLFLIGQFPVKMGVTGYTYDDTFKGVALQLGDAYVGGKFTLAYGRAAGINYNYTAPMMRGVPGIKDMVIGNIQGKLESIMNQIGGKLSAGDKAILNNISNSLQKGELNSDAAATAAVKALQGADSDYLKQLGNGLHEQLTPMMGKVDWETGTYYPMAPDVKMAEGEDEDVPVAYVSYIYRNPNKYEFHLYGMEAIGPVGHIAKAYGTAVSYDVTDKWNVHGEFVKNLRKLPLNNERPYSFNYGLSFGKADVLKEKSYSFGVDYVYSQAGTYFGGSGNDIADQYMGHVYRNWHGQKGVNMPAYIGDKLDAVNAGTDSPEVNYGGAKFFLAKAQYVPVKGLILEANYGFKAKDMGGRKMDDIFQLMATMYYK